MWKRTSLRARIYLILTSLVLITLAGGFVTLWYTYRMEGLMAYVFDRNLAAFQAAESLEIALINQKGFATYYFLDGDPEWLSQLDNYRRIFLERLNKTRLFAENKQHREAIRRIETEYNRYITSKDKVIAYYRNGEREKGAGFHWKVRDSFFETLKVCRRYKDLYAEEIKNTRNYSYAQAQKLRVIAVTAMVSVFFLGLLLVFVLVNQILGPIRRLTLEADRSGNSGESGDEVRSLRKSVRGLIEEYDHTHSELEKSRENLMQAEKLALVGKLGAGVAHSVRNPLTSVKMRLFSLSRSLDLSGHQKEDFEVISEEIRHIDTIVQNFLEFSRPPKLEMQKTSPSEIVDLVLQLLHHRLESYEVDIKLHRARPLPEIQVDPEQLKEAFVNLIVNSCEAMERGGLIEIYEDEGHDESLDREVIIRFADKGPGIPEPIQEKIFQPFFTTKEEGTGLGLSIVSRIVEEHGGRVDLESKEGEGAIFIVTLPFDRVK